MAGGRASTIDSCLTQCDPLTRAPGRDLFIAGYFSMKKRFRMKGGPKPGKNRWEFAYDEEESAALMDGLQKHWDKKNRWSAILNDPDFKLALRRRSASSLKDKLRNWKLSGPPEIKAKLEALCTDSASAIELAGDELADDDRSEDAVEATTERNKRSPYSEEESIALMDGLRRHGHKKNRWSAILNDPDFKLALRRRSAGSLKDKTRNWRLSRTAQSIIVGHCLRCVDVRGLCVARGIREEEHNRWFNATLVRGTNTRYM